MTSRRRSPGEGHRCPAMPLRVRRAVWWMRLWENEPRWTGMLIAAYGVIFALAVFGLLVLFSEL